MGVSFDITLDYNEQTHKLKCCVSHGWKSIWSVAWNLCHSWASFI